jgi:hypothetical protein
MTALSLLANHASGQVVSGSLSASGTLFSLSNSAINVGGGSGNQKPAGSQTTAAGVTSPNFVAGDGNNDSGWDSVAMGYANNAYGDCSLAVGFESTANGTGSVALGGWFGQPVTASGFNSTAIGGGVSALGDHSVALGGFSIANGDYSVAMGYAATTYGDRSMALGHLAESDGDHSTAFGPLAIANGAYTTAIGYRTYAQGEYSIVVGTYNNNPSEDDLFVVGNGSSSCDAWGNPLYDQNGNQLPDYASNALVVKMNGNTTVYGQLTVSGTANALLINPQGDLSMGQFKNPGPPQ